MGASLPAAPPRATSRQPPADLRRIFICQLQILGSTLGDYPEFSDLLAFVERQTIVPVIDSAFPMARIQDALDRLESGQQFGKVTLQLQAAA